jgi:colanic acid biosynthesis glycosyl transferase WcaI
LKSPTFILIYGINFSPELTGIGKYTKEMSDWLNSRNVPQIVVTGFPYYPSWKIQKPYHGRWYKKEIFKHENLIVYRCPLYVPKNPNGLNRILHELSFLISSGILLLYLGLKKNIFKIICISPPFHLGFNTIMLKFLWKIPFDYHVQDLQVQAAKTLKMINSNLLLNQMVRLQNYIYTKADKISTISHSMLEEMSKDTKKEISLFPNWVDCTKFFPKEKSKQLKEKYGLEADAKIIMYSGSIGKKQGLELLIEIANHDFSLKNIQFIISGAGPYFKALIEIVKTQNIKNITFLPTIAAEEFNDFLNLADIHLIPMKKGTSNFFMPSKLGPILAIGGLVIVSTDENTELHKIISENKIGILALSENKLSIIENIEICLQSDSQQIKNNARKYALQNLDREQNLQQYFHTTILQYSKH